MKLLQPLLSWSNASPQEGALAEKAARSGEKADSRFHGRFKIKCRVNLSWEDGQGNTCTVRARGVDMSRLGARVESPEPLTRGAFVFPSGPGIETHGRRDRPPLCTPGTEVSYWSRVPQSADEMLLS